MQRVEVDQLYNLERLTEAQKRFAAALIEWKDAGASAEHVSIALHDFVSAIIRFELRRNDAP